MSVQQSGQLLIQQRTDCKHIWPGKWDVTVGGGVDAGESSRQGAEREVREELGLELDLTGLRPSVTVNFDGGFDDFFLLEREVDLTALAPPGGRSGTGPLGGLVGGGAPSGRWRIHHLSQELPAVSV